MTLNDLAQVGLGTLGSGGGVWVLVRAYIALKPHLKNGGDRISDVLRHLEKQGDALVSIARDVHDSTERLRELVQDNRDYQKEGRETMTKFGALYDKQMRE